MYTRIVVPSELVAEAAREAQEQGAVLQVCQKTGQMVIADRLLRDFEPVRVGWKGADRRVVC